MSAARRVVLIGMMGAGKTTVGTLLASELGWPVLDLDRTIEEATGRSVAKLFADEGEEAFRERELAALREALEFDHTVIVATGGGIVTTPQARALLTTASDVVLLAIEPSTAARRIATTTTRPLLGDDPAASLTRLAEERNDLYAFVATSTIVVDALTPEETCAAVIDVLELRP